MQEAIAIKQKKNVFSIDKVTSLFNKKEQAPKDSP